MQQTYQYEIPFRRHPERIPASFGSTEWILRIRPHHDKYKRLTRRSFQVPILTSLLSKHNSAAE